MFLFCIDTEMTVCLVFIVNGALQDLYLYACMYCDYAIRPSIYYGIRRFCRAVHKSNRVVEGVEGSRWFIRSCGDKAWWPCSSSSNCLPGDSVYQCVQVSDADRIAVYVNRCHCRQTAGDDSCFMQETITSGLLSRPGNNITMHLSSEIHWLQTSSTVYAPQGRAVRALTLFYRVRLKRSPNYNMIMQLWVKTAYFTLEFFSVMQLWLGLLHYNNRRAVIMFCCWCLFLSSFSLRIIWEVARPIVTKLCHVFVGDPYLQM